MGRTSLWITRCLAIGHFAWGLFLLLLATWFVAASLRVLPHMSTGSGWTNLCVVLGLAMTQALPLGALGVWTVILGRWIWTLRHQVRAALLMTHGLLLLPGALAIAGGIWALRAAARSAAQGGGLMGGLGIIPLGIGTGVLALSLCSIALALTIIPRQQVAQKK